MNDANQTTTSKPLLRALRDEALDTPPIWLMRQAGRYLPEYRALRKEAGSFLDLCMAPEMACEVTLQPIRRFGFDGAILFSDILVIPYALGQNLWFEEGAGPKLAALQGPDEIATRLSMDSLHEHLTPIYETLWRVRAGLPPETTLLGFAGAPWTVASYMIEGGSSKDFATAKKWMFGDPDGFGRLIDLLVDSTAAYLNAQIEAGAEAVQIFDSWAGSLPAVEQYRWSLEPIRRIVAAVKARHPDTPVIVFPRGAGPVYVDFAQHSGGDALGIDTALPMDWARRNLQPGVTLQGNLDPIQVVAGGAGMRAAARRIVETMRGSPFVFNLGHGVVPQTPPEHVGELVETVRAMAR